MFKSVIAAMACALVMTLISVDPTAAAPPDGTKGTTDMSATSTGPIAQVALPTWDLEAAKAFYGDVLGLPMLFETGPMAFFNAGNVRLLLGPPPSPEHAKSGGVVYFQPDDIRAAAAELAGRGVKFMGEPERVRRTETGELQLRFFRDPDGNLLALMGEVPHNAD